MTILTIITNSNGHTVYFKEPIKNFQFIKLVSCSLFNSWINLKENGLITLTNNDDNISQNHIEIPSRSSHAEVNVILFQKYKLLFKNAFTAGNSCFAKPDRQKNHWGNPESSRTIRVLIP